MTTLVIKYPNGAKHSITPNWQFFRGDWLGLAQAIAGPYYPSGERIVWEVK